MKTKLSKRLMAWFVVSVMLISAILVIPVSGEWTLPDWVDPNPQYPEEKDAYERYWSWEDSATGNGLPTDENDGMPYDYKYKWDSYSAALKMSFVDFSDKTTPIKTAKAGDVVWLKVVITDIDPELLPDGIRSANYCISFNDAQALPFMMPLDSDEIPGEEAGCVYIGSFPNGDSWFDMCFTPTVNLRNSDTQASHYMIRYSGEDDHGNYMLGLYSYTHTLKNLYSDEAVWHFPIQLSKNLKDGEVVTFTVPYPQPNITVSEDSYTIHALKGCAESITIDNYDDASENVASGSSYAISNNKDDLGDKATGYITDSKIPLTSSADYDVVDGSAFGQVDFRGPADVNSVTLTFNTNDKSALPTEVKAFGVTATGDRVPLGTLTEGVAVNKGIANDETTNSILEWYTLSEIVGWEEEDNLIVNEANAYKYIFDNFDAASYVGVYFEATAATGKSVAVGEIEVSGEYSKFDVTVNNGTITNAKEDGYVPGDVLNIEANVDDDEIFTGWTIDSGLGTLGSSDDVSTTFVVGASDATVTANVIPKPYALTITDNMGIGTCTGSGEYAKGSTVPITAPAEVIVDDIPYVFSKWTVTSGSATIENERENETSVKTDGEATITAEYVVATYNLIVEGGSLVGGGNGGTFGFGDKVSLIADQAGEEEIFSHWEIVAEVSDENSYLVNETSAEASVVVYGNVTVKAVYVTKTYELIVESGSGDGFYPKGQAINITAQAPEDGMMFDRWVVVGDGEVVFSAPYALHTTVTIVSADANDKVTVKATYRDKYTLEVVYGEGSGDFDAGEKATIIANAPADGYGFCYWETAPGVTLSFAEGSMFSPTATIYVNGDITVTAKYCYLYGTVPDNLALDATVTLDQGTMLNGLDIGLVNDKLYPKFDESIWPLIQSSENKVVTTFALDGCYDVDKLVLNSGWLSYDNDAYLPSNITIYGANMADGSDKCVMLATADTDEGKGRYGLCDESLWNMSISVHDCPNTNENSYTKEFIIPEEGRGNFKYIIIEYDCNYSNKGFTNQKLMLGEVEIYGEESNFTVDVVDGSIVDIISGESVQRDDGTIAYKSGSVLQLKPDDDTDEKMFTGWYGCAVGSIDPENNTFTVGTADAIIIANFEDIHKPVPDNLAPGSTMQLVQGNLANGSIGTAVDGWYDGGYLNDQLYPLTYGAKWTVIQRENNMVKLVFDLGAQYDVTSVALTFAYGPDDNVERPSSISIYGANAADYNDMASIASLSNATIDNVYDVVEAEDGSSIVSVALIRQFIPSNVTTYRYVIIELPCNMNAGGRNPYSNEYIKIGEVEIYGSESTFNITATDAVITPSATDNEYISGTVLTITPNTIPDKEFIGWTVKYADGTEELDKSVTAFVVGIKDAEIIANYVDIPYTLTVNNGSGSGEYIKGTELTLVANTPEDPELIFDKWVIAEGSEDNIVYNADDLSDPSINITTNGVAEITATYIPRPYNLVVEQGSGDGDYPNGTHVEITADAPAADWHFDKWIFVSGDGEFVDAENATTTFITSNEPTTIRATYAENLYNVTVEDGVIAADDINENGYTVGTPLSITAVDKEDQKFIGWVIDNGNGTFEDVGSATTIFTTGSGDTIIRAEYEYIPYNVTIVNGSVSDDDFNEDGYAVNTQITIVADEAPVGQKFVGWIVTSGSGVIEDSTAPTTELVVGSGGVVVEAVFEKIPYSVTVENGSVVGEPKDEYYYGDTVTIVANDPEIGELFAGWTIVSGDGATISGDTVEAVLTVGTGDVVVKAEYADKLVYITIDGGYVSEEDISENGYIVGDEINIVAGIPEVGFEFSGWVIMDGDATITDPTDPTTTLVVGEEDTQITAVFTKVPYKLTVISGECVDGLKEFYNYGDKVDLVADEIDGYEFIGWTIVSGEGATLDDADSDTVTLTFGADDVVVKANYKVSTDTPGTGDRGIALYIVFALIALCGATYLLYKKQKNA